MRINIRNRCFFYIMFTETFRSTRGYNVYFCIKILCRTPYETSGCYLFPDQRIHHRHHINIININDRTAGSIIYIKVYIYTRITVKVHVHNVRSTSRKVVMDAGNYFLHVLKECFTMMTISFNVNLSCPIIYGH